MDKASVSRFAFLIVAVVDYPKLKKISPKQFIAFTGIKEVCEGLSNQVPYINSVHDLKDIANQIDQVLKEPTLIQHRIHFGIGGIDLYDNVAFYTVENQKDQSLNYYCPKGINNLSYAFF